MVTKSVILFVFFVMVSCGNMDKDCYEAELLDVIYSNNVRHDSCFYEVKDSLIGMLYNAYFNEYNILIYRFVYFDSCFNSVMQFNKYGEMNNYQYYKLYRILDKDTAEIWSKVDSLDYKVSRSLFDQHLFPQTNLSGHNYFVMRIEDISGIENGFVCIKILRPQFLGSCHRCDDELTSLGRSGICFKIRDGKLIKGKCDVLKDGQFPWTDEARYYKF